MKRMKSKVTTILLTAVVLCFAGCSDYSPKPKAYPRVIYPAKVYQPTNVDCPFTFEIPTYSEMQQVNSKDQSCWYNLYFKPFDATVHLSYISISGVDDLDSLAEDAYKMAFDPHIQRAEEIIEREIYDSTKGLYGMIYDLEGRTATPFNFYLSDQKQHFIRGSFYFNKKTEMDSILPIYKFLNEDIMMAIKTFEFK